MEKERLKATINTLLNGGKLSALERHYLVKDATKLLQELERLENENKIYRDREKDK